MGKSDAGKYREPAEREGDRAPAPREVTGHGLQNAEEATPTVVEATTQGDETQEDPETEGHIFSNPYMMERAAADRRDEMMSQAERMRQTNDVSVSRGLGDKIKERVRRRDNG